MSCLEEVLLTLDEYEAIRLADLEGLYQEQAAARMNISRQTFGRIIEAAHGKMADVLVNGKTLMIGGGPVDVGDGEDVRCRSCRRTFTIHPGGREGTCCPHCGSLK